MDRWTDRQAYSWHSPCSPRGRAPAHPGASGRAPPAPGPACRYGAKQKAPQKGTSLRPWSLLRVWDDVGPPHHHGAMLRCPFGSQRVKVFFRSPHPRMTSLGGWLFPETRRGERAAAGSLREESWHGTCSWGSPLPAQAQVVAKNTPKSPGCKFVFVWRWVQSNASSVCQVKAVAFVPDETPRLQPKLCSWSR